MNKRNLQAAILTLCGAALIAFGLALGIQPAVVSAQQPVAAPTGDNSFCTVCHTATTDKSFQLADGTNLSIAVDPAVLEASVHGSSNPEGALGCADCHGTDVFPHVGPAQGDIRSYRISASTSCTNCHTEQAENLADDVHYTAVLEGNLRAASCVDCHGGHDVQQPDEPRIHISQTCGECHQIVFNEYAQSVHGTALIEGDPNVPTCVECHGVHAIQHPTTALFRNRSPELCLNCHADTELMEQYGISTYIEESYLTDFHGSTVQLFNQQDPNVASNKAVCYDCHGVHNITPADGEKSSVVRQNLLAACQECHPDATADFPASWVGHFPPTLESHPLLFLVDLFYKLLIPVVLGGFLVLVATDVFARIRKFLKRS